MPGAAESAALATSLARAAPREPDVSDLRAFVAECAAAGASRRAVLLRLRRLPRAFAKPHHLRLARDTLDPLLHAERAQLFHGPGLAVAIWKGNADPQLTRVRGALAQLLDGVDGAAPGPLLEEFVLPGEASRLLDEIAAAARPPGRFARGTPPLPPLDLSRLGDLETRLAAADLRRFLRAGQVCAPGSQGGFVRAWDDRSLDIPDIAAQFGGGRDITRDRWLFKHLCRTLDRRLLDLLAAPDELAGGHPVGLALGAQSVLSPAFLRFDASLPQAVREASVIELSPDDAAASPRDFLVARDFAHARGYRLALGPVAPRLLPIFGTDRAGADLVRLPWSPELATMGSLPLPPEAVILGGVDLPDALAWGRAHGIRMFQGGLVSVSGRAG